MKFRLSAIIAIHFVLIHLWIVLFIHASEDENTKINFNFLPGITEDLEVNIQPSAIPIKLLHAISKHILSIMFTQYLTIHEILILRKSSTEFAILLFPNDKNTIMFCKNFHSKEMDEVPLTWLDLKYFLNESYISVFHKIKMFNIKGNQYVVLTHTTRDTKYISWHNNQTPYPKILFDNARKIFIEKNHTNSQLEYKQKEIYNNHGTAWAKITNQGKASFEQCEIDYFWNMSIPMYMGPKAGGNSKNIQSQLKNVQTIVSTYTVCASLLENGQVITWRDEKNQDGKISESIQFQLKNVKILISTRSAFAALLRNGNVIAWGDENRGGKIPKCKNVKMIFSNRGAFVALLNNGGVIAWGDENQGGKIPELIQFQLKNVKMIISTVGSFAALLKNGRVVAWGDENNAGKIPDLIQTQLEDVKMIFSNNIGFAALLNNGNVFGWGDPNYGGEISNEIQVQLKNVKMIFSNLQAFVALLDNGSIVAWGTDTYGGTIPNIIQTQLLHQNVKMIFSTHVAFCALLHDGSVLAWGDPHFGGRIPNGDQFKLKKNVKMIFPQKKSFTCLCNNGDIITWGED